MINPNDTLELIGDEANKAFKFIKKTQKISDYRGDRIGDGLIRIEFQFEEPLVEVESIKRNIYNDYHRTHWGDPWNHYYGYPVSYSYTVGAAGVSSGGSGIVNCSSQNSTVAAAPALDVVTCNMAQMEMERGITVKGRDVEQSFVTATTRKLQEAKHVIVLELFGETDTGLQVMRSQTSRTKRKCETCGTVNVPNSKFCKECGTSLS